MSTENKISAVSYLNSFGDVAKFYEIGDTECLFPFYDNIQEMISDFETFISRTDDVIVCAYMKCGTHWVWEIIKMLYASNDMFDKDSKETGQLEFCKMDKLAEYSSPRVLNTHVTARLLPKDIVKKQPKIVLVLRNAKDVAVSFYHHNLGVANKYSCIEKWESFLEFFVKGYVSFGSYVNYLKQWDEAIIKKALPIHVVYYEDLKNNTIYEIGKFAKYLELPLDKDLFERIAKKTDFSTMKRMKDIDNCEFSKSQWKDGKQRIYRKGEINDWKNWFTVSQSEWFDEVITKQLSKLNFNF